MNRVLVIDDDQVAVSALCSLLEMDGYEVVGLASPAEAIERLKTQRFDAVVTDLEMPRVHGLEVVKAAHAADAQLPILVVTAYVESPACRAALAAGARRVFTKPLRYEMLAQELESLQKPSR